MDTANVGNKRRICPILMLNYPAAPAVFCIPGACSAWRPVAGAGPGRCLVVDPAPPDSGNEGAPAPRAGGRPSSL